MYCRTDQNLTCTLIVFTNLDNRNMQCFQDLVWKKYYSDKNKNKVTNPYWNRGDFVLNTFKSFIEELSQCVIEYNKAHEDEHDNSYKFDGRAIVQFTTVDTQKNAEKWLETFGVPRVVGPVKKKKHPSGALSLWAMPVKDFLERLEGLKREYEITP